MIFDRFFDKVKITFEVDGKPPQKSGWAGNDAPLIIKLRKTALAARNKLGIDCISVPVKLKLTVYAPNIDDKDDTQFRTTKKESDKYVGDLDSLIAGICDYLSRVPTDPGENNFQPSLLFNDHPEIDPTIPLIIKDDSLIKNVMADKKESKHNEIYYVMEIEII